MKPRIARDTGEPLVVLGGYHVANDGGLIREQVSGSTADHGCDPLPDGTFRMVPSGDIVNAEEKEKRLRR